MSLVGQAAPHWSGAAHVGGEEQKVGSDDYEGKWHVLYFYPLDFTFI